MSEQSNALKGLFSGFDEEVKSERTRRTKENLEDNNFLTRSAIAGVHSGIAAGHGYKSAFERFAGDDRESDLAERSALVHRQSAAEQPADVQGFLPAEGKEAALDNPLNLGKFAAEQFIRSAPQMAVRTAAAAAGSAVGSLVAPGVGTIGGFVGGLAASSAMHTGDIYLDLREKGITAPGSSMIAGIVSGGVEQVTGGAPVLNKMLGISGVRQALAKEATRNGVRGAAGMMWDIGKGIVKTGAEEAAEEGFQEFVSMLNEDYNSPGFEWDREKFIQVIEAAGSGAVVGGPLGGIGRIKQVGVDNINARRAQTEEEVAQIRKEAEVDIQTAQVKSSANGRMLNRVKDDLEDFASRNSSVIYDPEFQAENADLIAQVGNFTVNEDRHGLGTAYSELKNRVLEWQTRPVERYVPPADIDEDQGQPLSQEQVLDTLGARPEVTPTEKPASPPLDIYTAPTEIHQATAETIDGILASPDYSDTDKQIALDVVAAKTETIPDQEVAPIAPVEAEQQVGETQAQETLPLPAPDANTHILTKSGKPFKAPASARRAAIKQGLTESDVVQVEGGYAVTKSETLESTPPVEDKSKTKAPTKKLNTYEQNLVDRRVAYEEQAKEASTEKLIETLNELGEVPSFPTDGIRLMKKNAIEAELDVRKKESKEEPKAPTKGEQIKAKVKAKKEVEADTKADKLEVAAEKIKGEGIDHVGDGVVNITSASDIKDARTYLLGEVDKAIEALIPKLDETIDRDGLVELLSSEDPTKHELFKIYEREGNNSETVTFNVPNDGNFKVIESIGSLLTFKSQVDKKFKRLPDATVPKPKGLPGKTVKIEEDLDKEVVAAILSDPNGDAATKQLQNKLSKDGFLRESGYTTGGKTKYYATSKGEAYLKLLNGEKSTAAEVKESPKALSDMNKIQLIKEADRLGVRDQIKTSMKKAELVKAIEDSQAPTRRKTEKVDWFVNYTEQEGVGRATEIKRFDTLKDARDFSKGKFGYITRSSDGGSDFNAEAGTTSFSESFGGFQPSAAELSNVEKIGATEKDFPVAKKPQAEPVATKPTTKKAQPSDLTILQTEILKQGPFDIGSRGDVKVRLNIVSNEKGGMWLEMERNVDDEGWSTWAGTMYLRGASVNDINSDARKAGLLRIKKGVTEKALTHLEAYFGDPESKRALAGELIKAEAKSTEEAPAKVEAKAEKKVDAVEELSTLFNESDIDYETARQAHLGTSMVPEKRAKQIQAGYVDHMKSVAEKFAKKATPEQMPILRSALDNYKRTYIEKTNAWLSAKSGVMSAMITGPANFPTRRNEAKGNRADKLAGEIEDWAKKGQKEISKELGLIKQPISSDDPEGLTKLKAKLSDLENLQKLMKDSNKIAKSKKLTDVEKAAQLTELGVKGSEDLLKPDDFGNFGFPSYSLTNNNAKIKSTKARIADMESKAGDETSEIEFDGGTIIDNVEDNRVQIDFDGKPAPEVIAELKKNGFKWARSKGVWQRQRNDRAMRVARDIAGVKDVKFSVEADQTNTPAFKKWFGDSKVVDADGEPLVVYHGGLDANKIEVFSEDYAGDTTGNNYHGAFYFSGDEDIARDYSRQAFIRRFEGRDAEELAADGFSKEDIDAIVEGIDSVAEEKTDTVGAYLKIDNPYIIDMRGEVMPVLKMQDIIGFIKNGVFPESFEEIIDEINESSEVAYDQSDINDYKDEINERAIENNGLDSDDDVEDYMFEEATAEVLEENGIELEQPSFDGIIVKNTVDDISPDSSFEQDVYIIFESTQIKSATDNIGTFDPNNPDIRFAVDGLPTPITEASIQESFPGSDISKTDDGFNVSLPSGATIDVMMQESIPVDVDSLIRDYGVTRAEAKRMAKRGALGATVPSGATIKLSDGSVMTMDNVSMLLNDSRAGEGTVRHEALHIAKQLGMFDSKSGKAIWDSLMLEYGSEEKIAAARENWEGQNGLWAKITQWFQRLKLSMGFEINPNAALNETFTEQFWSQGVDRGIGSGVRFQAEDQTNTPAFKKWFGDSKVVDEDGEPLVVYHGTTHNFTVFKGDSLSDPDNSLGAANYFTSSAVDADANYADKSAPDLQARVGLRTFDIVKSDKIGFIEAAERAERELVGGAEKTLDVFLKIKNPFIIDGIPLEDVSVSKVREDGHDGIIIRNAKNYFPDAKMTEGTDHYIAFSPTQIKSATDNIGTFDSSNPDIRFQADPITSIKNDTVDEMRELRNAGEITAVEAETQQQWLDDAVITLRNDYTAGARLINELKANSRVLSDRETAIVQVHYRREYNIFRQLSDTLFAAQESGDPVATATAQTAANTQLVTLNGIEEVTRSAGREWGRAGVARQIALKKDFSLEGMERKARVSNGGKALDKDQMKEIKKLSETIERLEARILEESNKVSGLESKVAHRTMLDELIAIDRKKPKKRMSKVFNEKVDKGRDILSSLGFSMKKKIGKGLKFKVDEDAAPGSDQQVIKELYPVALELAEVANKDGVTSLGAFLATMRQEYGEITEAELTFANAWNEYVSKAKDKTLSTPEFDTADPKGVTAEARNIQRELVELGILDDVKKKDQQRIIIDAVHETLLETMPDMTRDEAIDALSGYGQFSTPSKSDVDVALRELNALHLQVSKQTVLNEAIAKAEELREEGLSDDEIAKRLVADGLQLKATGFVRGTPTDLVRHMTSQTNELKKSLPALPDAKEGQLQSALDARKTAARNRIRDLKWEISNKKRIIRVRNPIKADADLKILQDELAITIDEHSKMADAEGWTEEQRIVATEANLDREIAKVEKQILDKDVSVKPKKVEGVSTPAIDAKRARLDALRAEKQALRDAINPKMTPEQRAIRNYEANILRRVADYQDRIADNDFAPRKKTVRELSDAELKLKRRLEDTKKEFVDKAESYRIANLSPAGKALHYAKQTAHLSRSLMTSIDLSAIFRQGGITVYSHPKLGLESAKAMTSALLSRQNEFNEIEKMKNHPLWQVSQTAKLSITTDEAGITKQEEAFMGQWADRVPGVAASGRAYTTFLNSMRFNLFVSMVENIGKNGQVTMDEAKVLSRYINTATGRADFKALNTAAANLNTVFFAPRYVASRFQYLAMPFALPFMNTTPRVKKLIAAEYARTFGGAAVFIGSLMALAAMTAGSDDEEPTFEMDPRSTDFMKIKISDTRIDPMSGLSQVIVFSSKVVSGSTKSPMSGEVKSLSDAKGPYDQTRWSVTGRFLRGKLGPVPGATVTMLNDFTDVVGKKHSAAGLTSGLFIPLSIREVSDSIEARGVAKGTAISMMALMGMGVGSYGKRTSYLAADKEERAKLFAKDLKKARKGDGPLAYQDKLTREQVKRYDRALRRKRKVKKGEEKKRPWEK